MSQEVEIVLHIVSAIIAAIAIAMFVIGIIRFKRKRHFPKYTVTATVVSKRAKVRRHYQKTGTGMQMVEDAFCYATFKVDDAHIIELKLTVGEYRALIKGEIGKLTLQGANFLGFERPTGEIVWEAVQTKDELEGESKKLGRKRKQKAQTEAQANSEIGNETNNEAENESESENKKLGRKRKQRVKAEIEASNETETETTSDTNSQTTSETESEAQSEIENEINS